jgi:hypothetical protein
MTKHEALARKLHEISRKVVDEEKTSPSTLGWNQLDEWQRNAFRAMAKHVLSYYEFAGVDEEEANRTETD